MKVNDNSRSVSVAATVGSGNDSVRGLQEVDTRFGSRDGTASPKSLPPIDTPIGTGTGSGQSSALMTPVAEYPASFARQMPAGQVGTTLGDPMPRRKVQDIQNWRQSQVITAQDVLNGDEEEEMDEGEDEDEVEEEVVEQSQSTQYPTGLHSRLGSEVPPSPFRVLQRRSNQVYGHGSGEVSPNGSMLVLPYGQSRSNSVESFSSFPSAVEPPEYDSDQSMLDDERK